MGINKQTKYIEKRTTCASASFGGHPAPWVLVSPVPWLRTFKKVPRPTLICVLEVSLLGLCVLCVYLFVLFASLFVLLFFLGWYFDSWPDELFIGFLQGAKPHQSNPST